MSELCYGVDDENFSFTEICEALDHYDGNGAIYAPTNAWLVLRNTTRCCDSFCAEEVRPILKDWRA